MTDGGPALEYHFRTARELELSENGGKAVKAGYRDAAHMKKDTDLDPLREREDFKKLLAELEGKK